MIHHMLDVDRQMCRQLVEELKYLTHKAFERSLRDAPVLMDEEISTMIRKLDELALRLDRKL